MNRVTISILLAAIACMTSVTTIAMAQERLMPTAAEKSAMRIIEAEAKTIAWLAYPTTNFTGVEYDEGARQKDGSFLLIYTFHGDSNGTPGFFTQTFRFQPDGKLTGIKDGAKSWFLSPYTEFEFVRGFLKELFKNELEGRNSLKNLLENGNGRSIAVGILNSKLGF